MALVTTAQANFLSDALTAVTGHAEDLKDRWTHDDQFVDGTTLASTSFRTTDRGRDGVHYVDGSVSIVWADDGHVYIQLGEDFKSGLAPDLYIYIADRKVVDEASFDAANTYEIAKLKSGSGAQFYKLPKHADAPMMDMHLEVLIWCKQISHQYMGAAIYYRGHTMILL